MDYKFYRKLMVENGVELWQCPPQGKYLVINRLAFDYPFYCKFFDQRNEAIEFFRQVVKK